MAQDWRNDRGYGSDNSRDDRDFGRDYGREDQRGMGGSNYPDRGMRGQGTGQGMRGDRSRDDDFSGFGRRAGGYGRGSGPMSDDRWADEDRDFSNDWGTGVGDMYNRGTGSGGRRNQPGFPSYGRSGGYDTQQGDAYMGRGRSFGSSYGGSYGSNEGYGNRQGQGYEIEREYRGGDYRGRQGAFIGQGGFAGEPTDHSDWSHEHNSGTGYSGGGRREDRGWFGGPTGGERPSWQTQGEHRGRGPKGYQRSDERIRDDVNDRLSDDHWVDASDVEIEVKDGEVTVTGMVDSREAKRRIEDIVESISGVKHCQNNLRIRSTGQGYGQSASSGQSGFGQSGGGQSGFGQSGQGTSGSQSGTGASGGQQAGGIATSGSGTQSGSSSGIGGTSGSTGAGTNPTGTNPTATRQH